MRVRGDVDTVRGEPAPPRRAPLFPGVLDQSPKARQHALVAEKPRVLRWHHARIDRGVGVPEEDGVVAEGAREERDVGEPRVQWCAVQKGAVVVLIGAGVEAGSRGPARRCIGPVVGEQHAPGGQIIQCRGLEHTMAQGGEAVATPLIQRDEQHVAGRRHVATLAHRDRMPGAARSHEPGAAEPDGALRPTANGLKTCGSRPLRASFRTRSARSRCGVPPPGARLGRRLPGLRRPNAASACGRSPAARPAVRHAATRPRPGDRVDGLRPGTALPSHRSSGSPHSPRIQIRSTTSDQQATSLPDV